MYCLVLQALQISYEEAKATQFSVIQSQQFVVTATISKNIFQIKYNQIMWWFLMKT